MSSNPQKPNVRMPVANVSTLPNVTAIEEDFEKLEFSGNPTSEGLPRVDAREAAERQSVNKSKAAIDGCMRTGEVMKALFPDGIHIGSEEQFAAFRLFDRLVGDITHFAQTGLTKKAALRDICTHAMLLESVLGSKDKA